MRAFEIIAGVFIGGLGYYAAVRVMGDAGASWIAIAIYVALMINSKATS